MNKKFREHILESSQLLNKINSNKIKIIDCRWYLDDSKKGYNEYIESHIPNSIFFDIEKYSNSLSYLPHMLPSEKQFENFLTEMGISKNNQIIVYDQSGFFCSSRVWFTFKYFKFKSVKILNGGFRGWFRKKYPVSKIINKSKKKIQKIVAQKNMIIKKKEIEKNLLSNKKTYILDARPKKRFYGQIAEPRKDVKSGNIPGSYNIPFDKISSKSGKLLSFEKLSKVFNKKIPISKTKEIICTCGSGITACNLIFVLDLLKYKNYKLYDGSWAEWGKK